MGKPVPGDWHSGRDDHRVVNLILIDGHGVLKRCYEVNKHATEIKVNRGSEGRV